MPGAEDKSQQVAAALGTILGEADGAKLEHLSLPWLGLYSDNLSERDFRIKDERNYTVVTVDFQFTKGERADTWVPRSDTPQYRDRIVWVVNDVESVGYAATKLLQSERMVKRYENSASSLTDERQRLLRDEVDRWILRDARSPTKPLWSDCSLNCASRSCTSFPRSIGCG